MKKNILLLLPFTFATFSALEAASSAPNVAPHPEAAHQQEVHPVAPKATGRAKEIAKVAVEQKAYKKNPQGVVALEQLPPQVKMNAKVKAQQQAQTTAQMLKQQGGK